MSRFSDPNYLLTEQYPDATNLNARIALHQRFSTNPYGWHRWVFDQFNLAPDSRILELGAGPGYLWRENLDRVPAGWDITLSDFSPGMVAEAKRALAGSGRPFRLEVIDAQSVPFNDASFDAVIANHMLFHVPDRPKALSEIRRVLRPGGRFYAATAGERHLREIGELLRRFDPADAAGGTFPQSFTLENGGAQLAPWFSDVKVFRYDDALVVTEVEPLVAFVASSSRFPLTGERRATFARFVAQEMAAQGGRLAIRKDTGLFEAARDGGR